jgi:hypothetical protein
VLGFLYARFLDTIPLFRGLSAEIIDALCRALVPILAYYMIRPLVELYGGCVVALKVS